MIYLHNDKEIDQIYPTSNDSSDACQPGFEICAKVLHKSAFSAPLQQRGPSQYLNQIRGRGEQRVKFYGSLAEGGQ